MFFRFVDCETKFQYKFLKNTITHFILFCLCKSTNIVAIFNEQLSINFQKSVFFKNITTFKIFKRHKEPNVYCIYFLSLSLITCPFANISKTLTYFKKVFLMFFSIKIIKSLKNAA